MQVNLQSGKDVRILILEHDASDLDLLQYELKKSGLQHTSYVVSTEKAYEKAIVDFAPDVILSDFSLPAFSGAKAFKIRQNLAPEVPFIFVSSYIGEEQSSEMLKVGITDYVMKDKLSTLRFKLNRALQEANERKLQKLAAREHQRNESRLNEAQKIAKVGSWEMDLVTGNYIWSDQMYQILDVPKTTKTSSETYFSVIHPEDVALVKRKIQNFEMFLIDITFEHRILRKDGSISYVYCESRNEVNASGQAIRHYGIVHDITERKLAEQQMDFGANNLKALINNTGDLMWSVDRNFDLITSNHAFEETVKSSTGKSLKKGINLLKLGYYDELNKRYGEYYNRAFTGESFTVVEYMNVPRDSWSEISFYPISSGDEIIGTACYSRDITERKLFERALERHTREIIRIKDQLEQSEKSLKEAQKMARLGNWETDLKTNRTIWSDETYQILGVDIRGAKPSMHTFLAYVHPEDKERVEEVIQEGKKSLNGFVFNCRIITENGTVKYTYCNCRYIVDEDGKPLLIKGILHDVTEVHIARDKTLHSESRLKQAQAITHVGNWETNFATNASIWSDEAYRIYGLEPFEQELSAGDWIKFIHPEDRREVVSKMRESFKNFGNFSCSHRIVRRNGDVRFVRSECKYEFDENKQPKGLYGIVFDVTEQKEAELQMKGLLDITREQNKRLQNFAYIISHNIRSHSSNITGLIDVFREAGNDEEKLNAFYMLETSTNKLSETIENLNEIITIQTDTNREKRSLNLKKELEKTCDAINALIAQTQTEIINTIEDDSMVVAVPSYMESILLNLISNSIKYRAPKRNNVIRVSAGKLGKYTVLSVEDNGSGIDLEKNGQKLFGMYKTFHSNKDARGLGLFITKNQVEAMNGKIEVESRQGVGTTFRVYFPEIG